MPKLFGVCRKQHFNLMVRCTSASLAAGVLFLLTQAFDCHILPATEAQAEGRLQRSTMRMDPFSKIVHCAPFNLMISPSPDYKVVVVAEDDVKAAVSAEVHGETLHLDVKQGFRTDKPIQVTIGLPRDKLKSVKNVFPKSDVAVSEGFSVQRFMAQVSGTARMVLRGLDAEEATLRTSGTAQIVAKGSIKSLSIKGDGVSKTFVQGKLGQVKVQLTGISEAHLDSTSDDMVVHGGVDMLSKVLYARGRCDIGQSGPRMSGVGAMAAGGIGAFAGNMHFGNMAGGVGGMFGNACQQVSNVHLPHFDLKWSCGIEVEGRFTCQGMPSGSSASASTSGNGGNGMPDHKSIYSTDEGTVRSCACAAGTSELNMFT